MSNVTKKETCKRLSREPDRARPILDLTRTVARDIFSLKTRPWDALPVLKSYMRVHGHELPYDEYDEVAEDIWVHVSAYLSPSAKIEAPAIICGGAKICHGAFVSGTVVGAFSTVGENSVVKNSILFDRSKICGNNSVASSIIGYEAIIGEGSIIPDTRLDGTNVTIDIPEGLYLFGKERLGAVVCDEVKIGASCVINPGAIIDCGSVVYPLTSVSGYVYPYSSVK